MAQTGLSNGKVENGGVNVPGLLAQLNSDYRSILRADAALHDHLHLWLQHMEEWMHFQQHVFDQIQEHCHHMDIDTSSPEMPHESHDVVLHTPARVNAPASSPAKPSPLGKRDSSLTVPRLPAAVVMTSPTEGAPLLSENEGGQAPNPAQTISAPVAMTDGDDRGGILRAPPSKPVNEVGIVLDETPLDGTITRKDSGKVNGATKSVTIQDVGGDLIPDDEDDTYINLSRSCTMISKRSELQGTESTTWAAMPKEHRMWIEVVEAVLLSAKKKKLYELRDAWIQPEAFMSKVLRTNMDVDFKILVKPRIGHQRTFNSEDDTMQGRHSVAAWDVGRFANPFAHAQAMQNSAAAIRRSSRVADHVIEQKQCSIVLDPQAPARLLWMFFGMLLMLYDLIVLPMQVFPLPDNLVLTVLQWVGQVFWTLDIFVTFITAVYVNTELRTEFRIIAKAYIWTWFPFDLIVVVALWVVQIVGDTSGGAGNAGIFRFVRMMRFLRLARLAKFEHYLQEALAAINSSSLILLVGIFKLMTLMIIISHLNACCFYAVGAASDGGWVLSYSGTSVMYLYLTSMHWAFTQFQGTSEIFPTMGGGKAVGERAYAVIIVMGALIILSSFVSSLTNMMMQLQALREERMGMARSVREYLGENEISKTLSIRVKKYIDWKQGIQRRWGSSEKVLDMLPIALQIDLQEEVRGPMILTHKFFLCMRTVHLRIFRNICHKVLNNLTPAPGEMVFNQQDHATRMYFMIAGISRYIPARMKSSTGRSGVNVDLVAEDLRRSLSLRDKVLAGGGNLDADNQEVEDDTEVLVRGAYLSEPTLWTSWEHCGSLLGVSDVQFVTIHNEDFDVAIRNHSPAHVSAIIYARHFVAGLNKFGRSFNDIIDINSLAEEEEEDDASTFTYSQLTAHTTKPSVYPKR